MPGWVDGWVAGLAGNIAISAQLELELWLSLAIIMQKVQNASETCSVVNLTWIRFELKLS